MKLDIGAVLVTLLSLPLAGGSAAETPAAGGNAGNGQRIFLADGCYSCHGTTGAGGEPFGPRLSPDVLSIDSVRAKVRTASGRMPVYSAKVLADSEIADIVAYLRSIPSGKDAKDIPLLNN